VAVSRRSGDEINPWLLNGDLRPEADIHGAGRHADAIKLIAEHDGAFLSSLLLWSSIASFLSSLLLWSSIASRFIIVGNQDESFVKSWMRLPIGVGQSIGQILRVGNQSRCGRCVR
jgi:hypothetical protein